MAADGVPGADAVPTVALPPADSAAIVADFPAPAGPGAPPEPLVGAQLAGPAASPDETAPAGPGRRRLGWRWAARGIALLAAAVIVMMVALAIGMRSNDGAIDDHYGTATATVLSVTALRTGIEFVDASGSTIRPEGGVLYPGLLSVGQQFVVEYSTENPQIARVAGRTASVGTVMFAAVLGITVLVTAPLIWWCLRRARLPLFGLRRGPGHVVPPVEYTVGSASRNS